MFSDLNVFVTAHAMARHAGQRQAVIAANVANADTPHYRARDIAPFETLFGGEQTVGGKDAMRASRPGHITASAEIETYQSFAADMPRDRNGNSVSIELEMVKAVETQREHDRALAIYKSALSILRTSLGRA